MSFSSNFKHLHSLHVTMFPPSDVVIKAFTPLWTEARRILTLERNTTSPRAHLTSGKCLCRGSKSICEHQFFVDLSKKSSFNDTLIRGQCTYTAICYEILNFNTRKMSQINLTKTFTKIAKFSYRENASTCNKLTRSKLCMPFCHLL